MLKGEADVTFSTGSGGASDVWRPTSCGGGAVGCTDGKVLRSGWCWGPKGLGCGWVLEIGGHGVRAQHGWVVWLAERVHGGFDSLETFVALLVSDVIPDKPLELVWLETVEFVNVCSSDADIIQKIEGEVFFEIVPILEVVCMLTPTVRNIRRVWAWKVTVYDIAHAINCFSPARGIHKMLSRRV
jgi:hypothetical protein